MTLGVCMCVCTSRCLCVYLHILCGSRICVWISVLIFKYFVNQLVTYRLLESKVK